jgi:NAD(P)-dependent dehydrogenase (short-subunit alcohol dehydrogenase family)
MDNVAGRTAFVTGGASGIGRGIARALIDAGARAVLADWDAESLERESSRLGTAALGARLDVMDRSGWETARRAAENVFGPVEILVNNPGVAPDWNELVDVPEEHFDRLIAIMLTGVFNGIRTFGGGMRDRREGHIVNTASMNGLVAAPRSGAYTAAKFGIVGMSEVLHSEMESYGVGVSVLCPGSVLSNLGSSSPRPEGRRESNDRVMDPRVVGEDVVDAIRENDLYVITHGEYRPAVARRADRLLDAFDRAVKRDETNCSM